MTYSFNNVRQSPCDNDRMYIDFELYGFPYRMKVQKIYGLFRPMNVQHRQQDVCPFCQSQYKLKWCRVLRRELILLFHQLIEHPSVRLEWLYLDHV